MNSKIEEFVQVDKVYRKKLFTIYILCVVIGAIIIGFGIPLCKGHIQKLPTIESLNIIEIIAMLCLFLPIPAAVYLFKTGLKILKANEYPYPGMKVIRPTKILTGSEARMRGKALIVLGIISFIFALVSASFTHYFFNQLRAPFPSDFFIKLQHSKDQSRNVL